MLPLVTLPTNTLRDKSRSVTNDELHQSYMQNFCRDIVPAMYKYEGIGLAAPQVDKNIRICVIGKGADKSLKEDLVLVNPEIEITSKKKNADTEGCLSVPGVFGEVKRASHLRVRAWNTSGEPISFEAKGFFARVIQHEVDHLNGILFIDRATDTHEVTPEEKIKHADTMRARRGNAEV